MARPKDFMVKYSHKVFAIDPASSFFSTGCGWAILNEKPEVFGGDKKKPLIHRSGIIKPFSNEPSLGNIIWLVDKLKEIWQNDDGHSSQPIMIVIERPVIYLGSPVNPMNLMDLTLLCGALIKVLNPKELILPTPREWKGTKKKEVTREEIISLCDQFSMQNIKRDIDSIALHKRHNVYDAIGLGIYGIHVSRGEIDLPRMNYKV